MSDAVQDVLREFGSPQEVDKFQRYYELLMQWNKSVNLTAIVDHKEVYIKHFWDSLAIMRLPFFGSSVKRVIDVGTGAGLPGIPLAVCNPEVKFTLCDSLRKRTDFLKAVVEKLNLKNVQVYHARSEDFARENGHRGSYDVVVARAVARLSILSELLVPFSRQDGLVVCYKGPDVGEELRDAKRALGQLGAVVEAVEDIQLPDGMGGRSLVVIRTVKPTPERFPRKAGVPQKKPL